MCTYFYLKLRPPITIINKTLHFTFIQLMMYVIIILDHIHHSINKSKMLIFVYNSDKRVYMIAFGHKSPYFLLRNPHFKS